MNGLLTSIGMVSALFGLILERPIAVLFGMTCVLAAIAYSVYEIRGELKKSK